MPTDDVNNADETTRARSGSAADPNGPAPFRAMSLDDLDPEPEGDSPRRRTRREARAEREARKHGEAGLPTSASVGGAARTPASAPDEPGEHTTRPGMPSWLRSQRRDARAAESAAGTTVGGAAAAAAAEAQPAPATEAPAPTSQEAPAPAPEPSPTADLDDDTRANPILTPPASDAADAASPDDVAAADAAAGEGALFDGAIPGAAAAAAPLSAAGAVGTADETAAAIEMPEPTDALSIFDFNRTAAVGTAAPAAGPAPEPEPETEPEPAIASPAAATEIHPEQAPADEPAPAAAPVAPAAAPAALAWVSSAAIADADSKGPTTPSGADTTPLVPRRRRSPWPVIAPIAVAVLLAAAYVVGFATAPLDNVAPVVKTAKLKSPEGSEIEVSWPLDGGAAIAAVGQTDEVPESSSDELPMASITKLVSVLMVLDQEPLAEGEEGPSYEFTDEDLNNYYGYVYRGESRLEVPVGGSLTQYELIEGILLGSANNYIDKLVVSTFGSVEEFAAQTEDWLDEHGLSSMTVVQPSGIDWNNTATPADVARLGALALENPVVAEIVAKKTADLPGVGEVENSNPLLGDEGVVGIKTGTLLYNSNIVVAKQIDVDGETVTVVASVQGQPDEDSRNIVARSLLETATKAAQKSTVIVKAETKAGSVTTEWGESADLVASDEVALSLWNGDSAEITSNVGDVLGHASGDSVGTIEATGSFATTATKVALTDDIEGPDLGWRLTHPLDLLGLN